MNTLIKSLFVLVCVSFTTNGLSETSFQPSDGDSVMVVPDSIAHPDLLMTDPVNNELLKKFEYLESNFNNYIIQLGQKNKQFESIINLQNEKINFLNLEVEQLNASTKNQNDFSGWISVLLGCVAIIVTVLGVVIALLSLIGYRTAIKKAEDKATETAELTAAETAINEIKKRVEDGSFNHVIEEAVQKLAYGTISTSDFDQVDDDHVD